MSVSENLFELRKRQCEERRTYLAELDLLTEGLRADATQLRAEVERAAAANDRLLARQLSERLDKLEGSIATVISQIADANDALAAAEQELRQHELAATRRTANAGPAGRRRTRRTLRAGPTASPLAYPDRRR
ncbi:MAG TPA: hypothetical protein VGQ90_13410 [Stellaceae bacterium]|nr:hypothetical protein [Stellaceae bacterium]